MEEIEKIKQSLLSDIDARLEKANGQAKESVKGIEEGLKTEIKNAIDKYEELKPTVEGIAKQLDAIELAAKRTNQAFDQRAKSFHEDLTEQVEREMDEVSRIRNRKSRSISFDINEGQNHIFAKAVGTVTSSNVTGTMSTQFSQNLVATPNRKVHIRSLIPSVPMTDANYSFPRYANGEGSVGIQTEGSAKSQTDADITYVTQAPIVIAHFQRHSEQILQDIPRLLAFTSGRMVEQLLDKEDDQILNGAGTSNTLNGLITQATAYAPTGTANSSSADRFSYLVNAISQLAQANYSPTGIAVNPYAYYELLQIKTTTKEYTSPYAAVTFSDNTLRLCGVPLYPTTAMATNAFLVGDFSQAEFLVRNAVQVDISREDSDNFQKNLVTIRVEERVGLATYLPGAFITGSWTALAS